MKTRLLAFIFIFLCTVKLAHADGQEPLAVYLTWRQHPESTILVCWITAPTITEDIVDYQAQGSSTWLSAQGSHYQLPGNTPYNLHIIELSQLTPNTTYTFHIRSDKTSYKFLTMPLSLDQTAIRFVVGGDMYHDGVDILHETNRLAASTAPHFALVGGDIAYATGRMTSFMPNWTHAWMERLLGQKIDRWLTWLVAWKNDMVTPDGRLVPILPVLGNHDVTGGFDQTPDQAPFFNSLFPMPGSQGYGVVDFGNYMSIFLLNSAHTQPVGGQQASWLSKALEQRAATTHKFALYHVPAFPSVRPFTEEVSKQIRQYWVPSFDAFHLTAAFENHEHAFKRTFPILNGKINPAGVLYFGDGAWGVEHPRRPKNLSKKWYLARAAAARFFFLVDVQANKRRVAAIASDGRLIDELSW